MKKNVSFMLIGLMFAAAVYAQVAVPRLMSKDGGATQAMTLQKLAVEVQILGFIAETRLTMTFYNPHSRTLEGELVFPLPEGATVSGYALDVNGRMVDGVVVEKEKGQRVFEAVVRRGVDPGLVEWVKGNNFRTRVYPLPSHGTRTVMVRYLTELEVSPLTLTYNLPMNYQQKVDDFSLKIFVQQTSREPRVIEDGSADLHFSRSGIQFVAQSHAAHIDLSQNLRLELPRTDAPRVLVEKGSDGWHYFCVLDETGQNLIPSGKPTAPERVTIFWDASGSRGRVDHGKEINLLRAFFKQFERQTIPVELVEFRNALAAPQHIKVANGDTRPLEQALAAVVYDGGTQLGCLPGSIPAVKPTFYLLFSDGNSNIGREEPGAFPAPLYAVTADSGANHPLLRHIAQSSGGEYLNLNQADPAQAAIRIGQLRRMLLKVDADPTRVDQPFPSGAQPVGASVILAARLMARDATVAFQYGLGRHHPKSADYRIVREGAAEGNLLRTYWAQRKVQELSVFPERNRDALVETGKQYGLVTPATSLIVLDRLEQYIEFGIEPPEVFSQWRDSFARGMAQQKTRQEMEHQEKISHLVTLWQNRVSWWNTEFTKSTKEKQEIRTTQIPPSSTAPASATTPPAPPPPAAQAPAHPAAPAPAAPALVARQAVPPQAAPPSSSQGNTPPPRREAVGSGHESISGVIKDNTGGVIPGVNIGLANTDTGSSREVISDDGGNYLFTNIHPGNYQLKAELEGFKPMKIEGIKLNIGDRLNFPIVLAVSEMTEEVVVQASAVAVETTTSQIDRVTDEKGTTNLPLNGRNPHDLVYQAPGVIDGRAAGAVTGNHDRDNNKQLNSIDASNPSQEATLSAASNVELRSWSPDLPYVRALKAAALRDMFRTYLEQKQDFTDSPGFYLDCADIFFDKGLKAEGLQVLTNLAELALEDAALLRVLAHRLEQADQLELALGIFRRVAALRPEEPQSFRDQALVCARLKQYREAMDLLNKVIMGYWDRFGEIELPALMEINALIPQAKAAGIKDIPLAPELVKLLDTDLRIVLTWDSDATDIDLWVTEPSGEKVMYNHNRSAAGGLISRDFTDGYGPEEYLIQKAAHGTYKIEADYYGTESQKLLAPVTLQVDIFTDFGRPTEKRRSITLRLSQRKDIITVGEVKF